ncbi:hypothetical protein B0J11DRAFT_154611 [Dendryphion nanum]|uniref:PH domain-containing protein n=1 Tax=Dendryphion nanum TaxID=256645 RepID=A0A9P9E9N7_9PLEO|nr:hypothetical protein B0J11DRAFT_154611 [Dendryphion nanum]
MADPAAPEAPPPPSTAKFSRYRSVRRAQAEHLHQQSLGELTATPQNQHQHQHQQTEAPPPVPAMPSIPFSSSATAVAAGEPSKDALVSRSKSRYHRRPTTSHATSKGPPTRSNTDLVPPITSSANTQTSASAMRNRALSSPQNAPRVSSSTEPRLPNMSRSRAGEVPSLIAKGEREPLQSSRDEARQLLQKETERQRRMQEKLHAERKARKEAEEAERRARQDAEEAERRARIEAEEAERKRLEQVKRDEEEAERQRIQREAEEAEQLRRRKEEEHERKKKLQKVESAARLRRRHEEEARKARPVSPPASPPTHSAGAAGFNMFVRKRRDDVPASPESLSNTGGRSRQTSNGKDEELNVIRPGGGGAVLGIDAPISAVNAGDRRVMVVCNKQHIYLPITPTTTPLDLIKSASNVLSEHIDVHTAVIMESFHKVDVKRPLRNYEHVRDVMNSWDEDNQNDLLIVDAKVAGINQHELLVSQVPDSKPPSRGFYIHYSSKPGSWSKRYLSLRTDGQLLISKSEGAKKEDNVCHLSDFDIYTPSDRKLSKIKPPKKICYAVKSQQKSNIYVDETRFVHFFCTNDQDVASLFYRTLHGWRSWYLVHVMGEGQKKKTLDPKVTAPFSSRNVTTGVNEPAGHARGASVSSHYQLGTFAPLLDIGQFSMEQKEDTYKPGAFPDDAPLSRLNSRAMHARKMSTRAKGNPPLSVGMKDFGIPTSTRQNSLTQSQPSDPETDVFSSAGLLGRTYSTRQRAVQEREQKASTGPFTEGPSLLNNMNFSSQVSNDTGLNRRPSVRSSHQRTSSDIQRNMSTRVKPRPLVDLTPQYREPPQHARKGRAFVPDGGAGPLVESATSVEEAIKIPSATDWRARPATGRPNGANGYERTKSLKGRGEALAAYAVNNHENVPEDSNSAFTGGGLLARAKFSQGHTPVGHGVMDGSKARGPMLDMREDSKFASGSLLASVNKTQGPSVPAIDRDKRRSMDFGY